MEIYRQNDHWNPELPSLCRVSVQSYLEYSCGELQRSGAWHTLLQLQLACGDRLRAATTCITLYRRQNNYRCFAQVTDNLPLSAHVTVRLPQYWSGNTAKLPLTISFSRNHHCYAQAMQAALAAQTDYHCYS